MFLHKTHLMCLNKYYKFSNYQTTFIHLISNIKSKVKLSNMLSNIIYFFI